MATVKASSVPTTRSAGLLTATSVGAAATALGALFLPWVTGHLANGGSITLSANRVKDDLAKETTIGGFIANFGTWILIGVAAAALVMIVDLLAEDRSKATLNEKEYGFVLAAFGAGLAWTGYVLYEITSQLSNVSGYFAKIGTTAHAGLGAWITLAGTATLFGCALKALASRTADG